MSDDRLAYFAYGSNLLLARLKARTPSVRSLGMATLPGHRIHFNKPGGDGSGKCGIEAVSGAHVVLGVLYEMDAAEKPVLDEIEGVGHGYQDRWITVLHGGVEVAAFTYYPSLLDESLMPYDWYKAFVLAGARQNGFPAGYIAMIESAPARIDHDPRRRADNWLLHDRGVAGGD